MTRSCTSRLAHPPLSKFNTQTKRLWFNSFYSVGRIRGTMLLHDSRWQSTNNFTLKLNNPQHFLRDSVIRFLTYSRFRLIGSHRDKHHLARLSGGPDYPKSCSICARVVLGTPVISASWRWLMFGGCSLIFLRTTTLSAILNSFCGISAWDFTKFATKHNNYHVQGHEMTK